jgi:hypothetical protein
MKPSPFPSLDVILSGLRTFVAVLLTSWPVLLCGGLFLNGGVSAGCRHAADNTPAAVADAGNPSGYDTPPDAPTAPDAGTPDQSDPASCALLIRQETNLLVREVTRLQDSLSQTCHPSGAMSHVTTLTTAPAPGGPTGRTPLPVAACGGKLTVQVEKLDIKRRNVSVSVFYKNGVGISPRAMPLDPGMEADRSLWLQDQGLVLQVKSCQASGCEIECLEWAPAPAPPGCNPDPLKE